MLRTQGNKKYLGVPEETNVDELSMIEVTEAIIKMKRGKALGLDDIPAKSVWQNGGKVVDKKSFDTL